MAELPAGSYVASVSVYGLDTGRSFCDAVVLGFSAAPAALVQRQCPSTEVLPDLSSLAAAVAEGRSYRSPAADTHYTFLRGGNVTQVRSSCRFVSVCLCVCACSVESLLTAAV